jgi:phage repressor protein C with HTH and peptisase S24 domain
MFTHDQVWHGIDRLARERGLTASGLARRAGLDPTTFNPSKRVTKQRKPRWPSTESLAKILTATGTPFEHFVDLMNDRSGGASEAPSHRLRCVPVDAAGRPELFDAAGFPTGSEWDEIDFPALADDHAYALEVRGSRFEPLYRDGDLLIVSPTASIRRHDRIVLRTVAGKVEFGILDRRSAQRLELRPLGQDAKLTLQVREVAWLGRILWASQ